MAEINKKEYSTNDSKQNGNLNILSIDIFEVLRALLRGWWIILIVTLIGAFGYRTYAKYKFTPLYSSSILLFVNNSSLDVGTKTISISTSDMNASSNLIGLYEGILNNKTTLDRVVEKCNLTESWGQVSGMISTSQVNETPIMRVTITCDDPVKACTIAKAIAVVLPERVSEIIDGSSMRIVDDAVVNDWAISPNLSRYFKIGAIAGFALACLAIFLMVVFDNTIHSEEYLTNMYNVPMLASIPELSNSVNEKYTKKYKNGKQYYYRSSRSKYYKKSTTLPNIHPDAEDGSDVSGNEEGADS